LTGRRRGWADFFGSLPAGFDGAIEGVLNDTLNSVLNEQHPEIVGDIRAGVVDVFDILTQLRVKSQLHFDVEPGPPEGGIRQAVFVFPACEGGGSEPGGGVHPVGDCPQQESWVSIALNWRNSSLCGGSDNPECTGLREYGLSAYDLGDVEGELNAYVTGFWDLTVERHTMTLAWGQLLLFSVEQVILPMVFGPTVYGLDDLLYSLVGGPACLEAAGDNVVDHCCEQLVERGDIADWDDVHKLALKSTFKQGLPLLITQLREQLTGQDVGVEDNLVIGTSDDFEGQGKACRLHDDSPRDLQVDGMGKDAPGARCEWRAGLVVGEAEPDPILAEFYAPRE